MTDQEQLVKRVHEVARRTKRKPSTLSRILFGNGNRLAEIEAGGSITMTTYDRALAKLAELDSAA